MRALIPILLISTVAGAYALGRWQSVDRTAEPQLATLASFRSAFEQGSVLERSYRFHGFVQAMSPRTVDEAAKVIEARRFGLDSDELTNFMIAWAAFDPGAALDWGLSRSGPFRERATSAALGGWAFHDPVAARGAFEELDPNLATAGLEEHLVSGWLKGGQHDGVAEYIESRPAGLERQRYTNLLTIEIMRDSPDAVIRWAESVADDSPDSYKYTAFQKAANIVAAVDPVRASKWVESNLGQDYAQGGVGVVSLRWLEVDPPAALGWLASLPAGEHDGAVKSAMRRWLNRAPEAAESWLLQATPAASLDVAVTMMLDRKGNEPASAIAWARRQSDRVTRYRSVLRIGRTWMRQDPEAAKTWLAQSKLSPDVKNAILAANAREGETPDAEEAGMVPPAATPQPGSPG